MAKKRKQLARAPGNTRGRERAHLKDLFLSAYRKSGTIMSAAMGISIGREVVYRWIKLDPDFAEKFRLANADVIERLEMSAMQRGVNGVERYVIYKGRPVRDPNNPEKFLTEKQFSDHCLEMLLSARDPKRYGRRNQADVRVNVKIVNEISTEILGVIRRRVPDFCPHCRTSLDITPKIAEDLNRLSEKFQGAGS